MEVKVAVTLFFTIVIISSILMAESTNLIYNGTFEQVTERENLWDGVDGRGRIKVFGNSAPQMADLTGDGREELIVGDEHGWLWYYKNSGTREEPKFTSGEPLLFYVGLFAKPCLIDWDNNGLIDLVIGDGGGHAYFVANTGKPDSPRFYHEPGFTNVKTIQYGSGDLDLGAYTAPAVADFSGDGKKDLLLGEGTYSANSVYLYVNSGSDSQPRFPDDSRYYIAYGDGREHLVPFVIDWNKDGAKDLIVGENLGYINLYLGKKLDTTKVKSVFEKPIPEPLLSTERLRHAGGDIWGERVSPCVIDWDNDGDLDIVFGERSGLVYLSNNIGSEKEPKFARPVPITGQDAMPDEKYPVGWDTSFGLHMSKPNGGRYYAGSYLTRSVKDAHSGEYAFEVKNLFQYAGPPISAGYPANIVITGRIGRSLYVGSKYRLTFYAKGDDMSARWTIGYSRRTEIAGVRGYEVFQVSEEFRLDSKWNKMEKSFTFPGVVDGEAFDCPLIFYLIGTGDFFIDDLTLVEE